MRVLMVTPEAVPFAKTGGLADVAGALPGALTKLGVETRAVMPFYAKKIFADRFDLTPVVETEWVPFLDGEVERRVLHARGPDDVDWYFIDAPHFFAREELYSIEGRDYPDNFYRFTFFCQEALKLLKTLGWRPDVVHCHDWQTGLVPAYLRIGVETPTMNTADPFYENVKTLFTIHNIAYQGLFHKSMFPLTGIDWEHFTPGALEYYNQVSLLKAGLVYGHKLNTVSQRYSEEIRTYEEFGRGMEGVLSWRSRDLVGILNGIDVDMWNPATDEHLSAHYTPADLSGKADCKRALMMAQGLEYAPNIPLIGIISRLDEQKGFDLIEEAFERIMALGVRIVLLGTGKPAFHEMFKKMKSRYPEQLAINLAFDNALAHQIEAGADMFLMPSRFEPCGLNQMYSLRYGTVPIVHATGGLADTVVDYSPELDQGNGFSFMEYDADSLVEAVERAVATYREDGEAWNGLVTRGMEQDFSWTASAGQYHDLYREMIDP